ncbi:tyrosine-protein phosphatase [Rhizobium sp. C4]|nr:tyrosine-protein phosphatase [Rhizobium sp. C4]
MRDLGGYPKGRGGHTRWRRLFRGDALHALTPQDMETLVGHGLATVIDLRNAKEIAAEANPFSQHDQVRYVNIPLFQALSPVELMAAAVPEFDMGERYCHALDHCQSAIAEVLTTIAQSSNGGLLFHCSAGKDRTGIIAALLLANAGVEASVIIEDYVLTASISGPLIPHLRARAVSRGLDNGLIDIILASEPASMARALAHIDSSYGDCETYLRHIGLGATDISALQQTLCD